MKCGRTAVVVVLLLASLMLPVAAGTRSGKYLGGLRGIKELSLHVDPGSWGIFPGIRTSDILPIIEQPILNIGIKIAEEQRFRQHDIPRMSIRIQSHQAGPNSVYTCEIWAELVDELSFKRDSRRGLFLAIWQRKFSDRIRAEDAWVVKAELVAMMAAFVTDYLSANTVDDAPEGSRTTTGGVYDFEHKWGKDGSGVSHSSGDRQMAGPLAIAAPDEAAKASAGPRSGAVHSFSFSSSSSGGVSSVRSGVPSGTVGSVEVTPVVVPANPEE